MRRVGDQHLLPGMPSLALVIGAHHHQAAGSPLRPPGGLQRHPRKTRISAAPSSNRYISSSAPLQAGQRLRRMDSSKARHARHALVDHQGCTSSCRASGYMPMSMA